MSAESRELANHAFAHRNVRLFVWFRILFNCRFYYPVLAVFFVDLGLSVSQFVILNVIWAVTIVLLEVPSGALADLIGRKRLVVASAALMIVEMALLVFAPRDGGMLLFTLCAINRILAGVAEAAASGADEALAYDSLDGENTDSQWEQVLSRLTRWQSLSMAAAMLIGAAVFDQNLMNGVTSAFGLSDIPRNIVLRIPVTLCLIQAIIAFCIALRLRDIEETEHDERPSIKTLFGQTLNAGSWVIHTKVAAVIIIGGFLVDAIARNFATLTSTYFRFIQLPEYSFGLIGAGMSAVGFLVPFIAKPCLKKFGVVGNLTVVAAFALTGLTGIAVFTNLFGIFFALLTMVSLGLTGFIVSAFLNRHAPRKDRATILSVKGLLFNLGYAGFSLLFAQTLSTRTQKYATAASPADTAFGEVLLWTPAFLFAIFLPFALISTIVLRKNSKASH